MVAAQPRRHTRRWITSWGVEDRCWNIIWKFAVLQRVRQFRRLAFQDSILTNLERVWKNRNDPVFNEGTDSSRDVVVTSLARTSSLSNHKVQQLHVFVDYELSATWCPLQDGWVKLNWNVSMSVVTAESPIGGVLRGNEVVWIFGYSRGLNVAGIFRAEAKALLEGLVLAWNRGFGQVEVESDNSLLINLICTGRDTSTSIIEVQQIRDLCHRPWQLKFRHISWDSNMCADGLAKNEQRWLVLFVDVQSSSRDSVASFDTGPWESYIST
ncbi:hypothetical protein Gogos_016564 [Gossypium gossypioides]|uniref:RNase H type-1 domain-containing protein n=1 Tax=Gossypium gossypioides TaxID=34282 RepID=A0A7J9B836_GOSGO|nr:hypothetical protein [Gossypium gossypioides]